MTDLGMVKEALNQARIKCKEEDKKLQAAGRELNIHDAFAILAVELAKVCK